MKLLILFIIHSVNLIPYYTIYTPKFFNRKITSFLNEITLKIDTDGTDRGHILFDSSKTRPNEVILNGSPTSISDGVINVLQSLNSIILRFSSPLKSCEKMFKICSVITEIDFSYFDSSEVENINNMFEDCSSLKSIIFGNFDTSKVKEMNSVFRSCKSLESLDLSKFDTSNVNNFDSMFEFCFGLISLDLSNFKNNACKSVFKMFYYCKQLQRLNLSGFQTSNITTMSYMFSNCHSIRLLNLSSFDTSKVINMNYMFDNCHSLTSLDLSSFNLKSIEKVNYMFNQCTQLRIVKIKSTFLFPNIKVEDSEILTDTPSNIIFCVDKFINSGTNKQTDSECSSCTIKQSDISNYLFSKINLCCYPSCQDCDSQGIDKEHLCKTCKSNYNLEINIDKYKNCYKACSNLFYLDNDNKLNCVDDIKCPNEYNKLIKEKKQCIKKCNLDNKYQFEYENICYEECPEGSEESNMTPFLCATKQIIETHLDIISTQELKKSDEIHFTEYNLENKDIIFYYTIIENIKVRFNISELNSKNEIIYEQDNLLAIMSKTDFQKMENYKSTINLGNCETKLKNHYNISLEETLYILKIEFNISGMKIPKIEYEVFYPFNKTEFKKLNLSICKNEKIIISIPVEINDIIDKYNPKSDYYNDICYTTTSEFGTDISLPDRKEEFINKNMTLCDDDCTFVKYDYTKNKSICSCEVKIKVPVLMSEIKIDKKKLYDSFTDITNIANILILKCYKLLFSKKGLTNNFGLYILIPIFILFIICRIIFFIISYKRLINKIDFIIYSKLNWNRLKEIYIKSNNKKYKNNNNSTIPTFKKFNNNKNKLNYRKNKIKKKNKLFQENNINSKRLLNIKNTTKKKKNTNSKKINQINNMINLINKKNKRSFKNTSLKTKIIENKLKISGLCDIKKFELIEKIMKPNDYELNNLKYKEALAKDKRTFSKYYFSLLRTNHLFIFSFIQNKDYNSKTLKIVLFFFIFTINFITNALFFNDSTMHVIYEEKGKFDFLYQISKILYSTIITSILTLILRILSLTEKSIISLKNNNKLLLNQNHKKVLSTIKIKVTFFFSIGFFFFLVFCYYIGCFCSVYKNTQIHLIKDFISSFVLSLIYPFLIYLLPGIFRISSLKNKKRERLYNLSILLQYL